MYAKFKCLKCGYKYLSKPGPTKCPKCNHLYVKWINYEEMYELIFKPNAEKYWNNKGE